jgi:hypothetical protein
MADANNCNDDSVRQERRRRSQQRSWPRQAQQSQGQGKPNANANPFRSKHRDLHRNNLPAFEDAFATKTKTTPNKSSKSSNSHSAKPAKSQSDSATRPTSASPILAAEEDKENVVLSFYTTGGELEFDESSDSEEPSHSPNPSPIKSCLSSFSFSGGFNISSNKSTCAYSEAGGSSFIGNSNSNVSMMNTSVLSIGCRAALNEHRWHIAKHGLDSSVVTAAAASSGQVPTTAEKHQGDTVGSHNQNQQTPSPLSMVSPAQNAYAQNAHMHLSSADAEWDRLMDGSSSFVASSSFLEGDGGGGGYGNRSRCNTGNTSNSVFTSSHSRNDANASSVSVFDSSVSNCSDFFNSSRVHALATPEKNKPLVDEASALARQGIGLCQRDDEYEDMFSDEDTEDDDESESAQDEDTEWTNQTDLAERVVRDILGISSYSNMTNNMTNNRSAVNLNSPSRAFDLSRLTINEACEASHFLEDYDDKQSSFVAGASSFVMGGSFTNLITSTATSTPSNKKSRSKRNNNQNQMNLFEMSPIVPDRADDDDQAEGSSPFAGLLSPLNFEENDQTNPNDASPFQQENSNNLSGIMCRSLDRTCTSPNEQLITSLCGHGNDREQDNQSPVVKPSTLPNHTHERSCSDDSGYSSCCRGSSHNLIKKALTYNNEKSNCSFSSPDTSPSRECEDAPTSTKLGAEYFGNVLHTTNPNTPEYGIEIENGCCGDEDEDDNCSNRDSSFFSFHAESDFGIGLGIADGIVDGNDPCCSFISPRKESSESEKSFSSMYGNSGAMTISASPIAKTGGAISPFSVSNKSGGRQQRIGKGNKLALGAKCPKDMFDISPIKQGY